MEIWELFEARARQVANSGGTARCHRLAPDYWHRAASWVPKAASAAAFMSGPTRALLPFRTERLRFARPQ